jgi:predicted RNase H-like nuclease
MVAVGIDACATGWIAVVLRPPDAAAFYLPTISLLTTTIPDASAVAIDIPIGLPTAGSREADKAARRFLGARGSSVFPTPVREAARAASYARANSLQREVTGSGISQQSYALRAKILEVDDWLPSAPCRVWEVHPEVSVAVLIGHPTDASKKSWSGMVQRRQALLSAGINLETKDEPAGSRASVDDMLDAGAAAWTAQRLLRGEARSFPDLPAVAPPGGRTIAIWA